MAYEVDQNTVSLLHFEDGIKDETGKLWTAQNGATISTAKSKIGNSSLYLNGTNQYLVIPYDAKLDFASGDFTVDFWVNLSSKQTDRSLVGMGNMNKWSSPADIQYSVGIYTTEVCSGSTQYQVKSSISDIDTWYHIAIVKNGSTLLQFTNGVLVAKQACSRSINSSQSFGTFIGVDKWLNAYANCYIDEFRISNIARWTSNFTPPGTVVAPNAPINLTATPGDSQVTLNWDMVTGATSYNVKRSTTAGGSYETIATNVSGIFYVDTNLVNGTTYYYVVTAINATGESSNSNEALTTPVISMPLNLTATAGNFQVALSWNAVANASGYNVKRSTTAGGPYTTIASNVATNSYTDTTVTNGTTYYYVVTALGGTSESLNSHEASATPVAPINVLLRITLNDSSEREYKITQTVADDFIIWCNRTIGTGNSCYVFDKSMQSSKEYLFYEKIICFEVIRLPAE